MARSAECRCESNFTCWHCLRNAKPWFFTPRTMSEVIADDQERIRKELEAKFRGTPN